MALLTRVQIDAADDRTWEDVPVPEWGGEVRLLGLSGTERDAYEASMVRVGTTGKVSGVNLLDASARLLARCIVDEDFQRLYTDKEVQALGARNGKVIKRLYAKAQKISGLGKDAAEDAAGNSEPAPSGPSTSA
ncbi:phage tail assembly chaperone [Streptomyces sp. TBY4]|uniref:phage tail assembly chaperone n=1 Tax=Streptomyces sp. TBY4 TaxID=2962030 RepID=UPI0020B640D1|nr:phage tail assembly chaperone [Streptomyces sp. TBY4]MCP3758217.1 phage tail assembly chaperone [Streptomyces sp. TBY4]